MPILNIKKIGHHRYLNLSIRVLLVLNNMHKEHITGLIVLDNQLRVRHECYELPLFDPVGLYMFGLKNEYDTINIFLPKLMAATSPYPEILNAFSWLKIAALYFDANVKDICSDRSNQYQVNIGLVIGLTLK